MWQQCFTLKDVSKQQVWSIKYWYNFRNSDSFRNRFYCMNWEVLTSVFADTGIYFAMGSTFSELKLLKSGPGEKYEVDW